MPKREKPGTQLKPVGEKAHLQPGEETIDEKRGRIYQDASPALRKEFDWIQEWFEEEAKRSIKVRWELAQRIRIIYDDTIDNRGNRYGVHAVEQICSYFGWDEGMIYNALTLSKQFSQEEIDQLCEKKMQNGAPISYSHVMSLSAVHDPEERKKLIDKAAEENWTSRELARAVVQGKVPARSNKDDKRGRPIGKPKTFDTEVAQMETFVSDFLNRAEQVWYADDYSLDAKIADFTNEEFTEERSKRLRALAEQMGKLWSMSKKLQDFLMHIYGIFVKIQKETKPALKVVGSKETGQKATKKEAKAAATAVPSETESTNDDGQE